MWVFLLCWVNLEIGKWIEDKEKYFEFLGGVVGVLKDIVSEKYLV